MGGMAIGAAFHDRLVLESCIAEPRVHFRMAGQAHLFPGNAYQFRSVAAVRIMADNAGSYGDRPMDIAAFEFVAGVAFQAELLRCLRQTRRSPGSRHFMAKRAHLLLRRHAQHLGRHYLLVAVNTGLIA